MVGCRACSTTFQFDVEHTYLLPPPARPAGNMLPDATMVACAHRDINPEHIVLEDGKAGGRVYLSVLAMPRRVCNPEHRCWQAY